MSEDEAANREERVAIMVVDGGISEAEAQAYCDTRPELYGIREVVEIQGVLL